MLLRESVIYDDPASCASALSPSVLCVEFGEHISSGARLPICMSLIGSGHVLGEARNLREKIILEILGIDRHQRGDRLAVSRDKGSVLRIGDVSDDATCIAL
jgi:hypothetical protein